MRTGPGLGEPQGVSPQDEPAASDARAEGERGWGRGRGLTGLWPKGEGSQRLVGGGRRSVLQADLVTSYTASSRAAWQLPI